MHEIFEGIEAVVFDFDGTLIDSLGMWHEIDVEYTNMLGVDLPEDFQKQIEGMHYPDVARYFKKLFNIDKTIEEIMADWNEMAIDRYSNSLKLKEGSVELMQMLKNKGIRLAIATSNARELIDASLKGHGIDGFFSVLCTSEDVKKGKPDPEVYTIAVRKLNIAPDKCLAFEDLPMGLISARDAGLKTCAVYDEYSEYVDSEKRKIADYYVNSFKELL